MFLTARVFRLARDSGSTAIEYALYRLKFAYKVDDPGDLQVMDVAAETVEVYDTRKDSLTLYYKPLALLERLLNVATINAIFIPWSALQNLT